MFKQDNTGIFADWDILKLPPSRNGNKKPNSKYRKPQNDTLPDIQIPTGESVDDVCEYQVELCLHGYATFSYRFEISLIPANPVRWKIITNLTSPVIEDEVSVDVV